MMKALLIVTAALFLAATGLSLSNLEADACGDVNEVECAGRDVVVDEVGAFTFYLDGEWHLKSNPSWVMIQLADTGSNNVKQVQRVLERPQLRWKRQHVLLGGRVAEPRLDRGGHVHSEPVVILHEGWQERPS